MVREFLAGGWAVAKIAWLLPLVLTIFGAPALFGEMRLLHRVGDWVLLVMLR